MNYSDQNWQRHRETNGRMGMRVDLGSQGAFWSKGWKGCEWCNGDVHAPIVLHPFKAERNGETVSGFRCRP